MSAINPIAPIATLATTIHVTIRILRRVAIENSPPHVD
jgi:hypothetical protein